MKMFSVAHTACACGRKGPGKCCIVRSVKAHEITKQKAPAETSPLCFEPARVSWDPAPSLGRCCSMLQGNREQPARCGHRGELCAHSRSACLARPEKPRMLQPPGQHGRLREHPGGGRWGLCWGHSPLPCALLGARGLVTAPCSCTWHGHGSRALVLSLREPKPLGEPGSGAGHGGAAGGGGGSKAGGAAGGVRVGGLVLG